jgi:ABC-type thiamin/hydroxymethylpyrimidine transport system permease subunit
MNVVQAVCSIAAGVVFLGWFVVTIASARKPGDKARD